MRRYITRISLSDFAKLYPEKAEELDGTFPYCIAISKKAYPVAMSPNQTMTLVIENVKHIYSTRDYWEAFNHRGSKFKIPKRLTKVIYQVEANEC